jgi:hypothetical protein
VGPPAERFARVRRAEQEATLSYRVTTELTAENHWPSRAARVWAVGRRAHRAHQRARTSQTDHSRATPQRSPARPRRERDDNQEGDRTGGPARWRARVRERGGAER